MGYKLPMSDDYQIHIPPSFEAVHADARGRLTLRRDEFHLRYELSRRNSSRRSVRRPQASACTASKDGGMWIW